MIKKLALLLLLAPSLLFAEEQYFQSDGVAIHYRDVGTGPAVVLIHGWSGRLDLWEDTGLLDALAKDYRVVAIDIRGHGLSEKPHDPSMYGIKMAEDVRNLMDHLRIDEAHVMGYSLGAVLTGVFLDRWPERLVTATFAAGMPIRTWDETTEAFFDGAGKWARQRAEDPEFAGQNDWFALALASESIAELVVSAERLSSVDVPVLGVVGSLDQGIGGVPASENLQGLSEELSNYELIVVDGATHAGETGLQSRAEFREAFLEFIAGNGR